MRGNARRVAARTERSLFGSFAIMYWTLFEFIETRPSRTPAVAKVPQLMMHEECGAVQNYVVADAGSPPDKVRVGDGKEMRFGWERLVVEKQISPLRCSR
jgi:hypothetical protein